LLGRRTVGRGKNSALHQGSTGLAGPVGRSRETLAHGILGANAGSLLGGSGRIATRDRVRLRVKWRATAPDIQTALGAVPEFKVPLPGGDRPSHNDLFLLGCSNAGPVSVMVEGKVSESFGPTIAEWSDGASPGKKKRLAFLLKSLGLSVQPDGASRYQLFHRAASAVLEGERYRAVAAMLLTHSFSADRAGWPDYKTSWVCLAFGLRLSPFSGCPMRSAFLCFRRECRETANS